MDNKKLYFLTKTADILVRELDSYDLVKELKDVLATYLELKDLNIYVFDPNTSTLRNYAQNWCVIDEVMKEDVKEPIYNAYNDIHGNDFVINNKAFKLPQTISEISFKIESLYMPIVKNGMVFGVIELLFSENFSINMASLFLMKIFGAQISLKLQNIVLNEQSQINVEFHDSMKNIAKIIETQYEINYIVPLIGEMLDRFISDHLIYVFLKQDEEFRLVWPKACNDERVFEILKQLDKDYPSMMAYDDKIGAFPLLSDDEITGCIVATEGIVEDNFEMPAADPVVPVGTYSIDDLDVPPTPAGEKSSLGFDVSGLDQYENGNTGTHIPPIIRKEPTRKGGAFLQSREHKSRMINGGS